MQDEKYVVFKRQDWLDFCEGMGEDGVHCGGSAGIYITDLADRPLNDATVIRGQDLLAQPLLSVYVDMLAVILKTGGLSDAERVNLQRTSDYFHDRAAEAHELGWKLPD